MLTVDEQAEKRAQQLEEECTELRKGVMAAGAKITELIVGATAAKSHLALSKDPGGELIVIDSENRRQLEQLASGSSSKPFFDASVQLRNLASAECAATPVTLGDLVGTIQETSARLEAQLVDGMLGQQPGAAQGYTLLLRPDVTSCIAAAYDRLPLGNGARRVALWEILEGGCAVLTHRFAEAVAVLLASQRANRVLAQNSRPQAPLNATQARVVFQRLEAALEAYVRAIPRLPPPAYTKEAGKPDRPDPAADRAALVALGRAVRLPPVRPSCLGAWGA